MEEFSWIDKMFNIHAFKAIKKKLPSVPGIFINNVLGKIPHRVIFAILWYI